MTHVLALTTAPTTGASSTRLVPAAGDGILVDVAAGTGPGSVRVVGLASGAHTPEDREDDDAELPGWWLSTSLYTDQFWLGLYRPDDA